MVKRKTLQKLTELVQIQIASSILGIRLMVDHVTLTHAVGVRLSHPQLILGIVAGATAEESLKKGISLELSKSQR